MVGYTKLFQKMLASSIWDESPVVCKVWVTMLLMCDRDGVIEASILGISNHSRCSVEDVSKAIEVFTSPDPYSGSDRFEGRRVEKIDGGWKVLNYEFYRDKGSVEEMKERAAARQQRRRDRESSFEGNRSHSRSVTLGVGVEFFEAFWEAFDKKVAKPDAERAWQRLNPDAALAATIIAKAKAWKEATPDKAFRPYPATWLNRRGWEDELPTAPLPKGMKSAEPQRNAPAISIASLMVVHTGKADCPCDRCVSERKRAQ